MPKYEYKCKQCGIFEEFQRITSLALEKCPRCGGEVKRLISRNVNILYKTSGFYTTDYRSENYREEAKKEKEERGAGEGKKESAAG